MLNFDFDREQFTKNFDRFYVLFATFVVVVFVLNLLEGSARLSLKEVAIVAAFLIAGWVVIFIAKKIAAFIFSNYQD